MSWNKDIGENGKSSLLTPTYSDNIIMLHGGIAANAVEYKFKDKEGNYIEDRVYNRNDFDSVLLSQVLLF